MWCCELRRGFFGLQPKIVLWGVWERVKLQEEGGGGGGEREREEIKQNTSMFFSVYMCVYGESNNHQRKVLATQSIFYSPH